MLSPDSGCNLTFGTVKIEDTVKKMKSYIYVFIDVFIVFYF